MNQLIKWLERLSLDAVIVAVAWGIVLGDVGGTGMDGQHLLILALSTWLTYVADRLRDVGGGRLAPETDRHVYYKNHYKTFRLIWAGVFLGDVLLAFWWLPLWKVQYGFVLVPGVIAYLVLAGRISRPSIRIAFKRLAVPLIFTIGVGWMAESWRTPVGQHATAVLLIGAFANLLLISDWENMGKKAISWLYPVLLGVFFLMAMTGIAGLVGALCYGAVALTARRRPVPYVRAIADSVLVLMAVVVWVWM